MVALRSRRLESLFGTTLEALRAEHVQGLVTASAQEAFDLDFKAALYGHGDSDRRALAGDVAALANTAGGVIVLGVAEDSQARAVAAPGVEITDAEVARIRQVIASLVAPMPVVDVLTVPASSGDAAIPGARPPGGAGTGPADAAVEPHALGFVVIAVPRSPAAPHAVLVHQSLRYPKRNGATTRYLSEPEVAAAYRERLAGAQYQSTRLGEVEREALERLDPAGLPWVVVTLAPELPGDLFITNEVHRAFQDHITGQPATITSADLRFRRVSVGPGRLLADGTMDNSPLAKWVSLDLHTDGAGSYGVCVLDLMQQRRQMNGQEGELELRMIHDEALVIAVLSGLLHLACHARERAAAGGAVLVRAQIYPLSAQRPAELGRINRHGFADALGTRVLTTWPRVAEAAAPLDDLAQPGPSLIQAGAVLISQIGHAFGIAELGQLSRDGQIRRRHWAHTPITGWAEQHGIGITEDTVTMSW